MSLHAISYPDQLANQGKHCCICFNRQREKTPIWEQDYLLLRKIVKVALIGIVCTGAFYLLKDLCQAAYNDGFNRGVIDGRREGRDDVKQEALDRIALCQKFYTLEDSEDLIDCIKKRIIEGIY